MLEHAMPPQPKHAYSHGTVAALLSYFTHTSCMCGGSCERHAPRQDTRVWGVALHLDQEDVLYVGNDFPALLANPTHTQRGTAAGGMAGTHARRMQGTQAPEVKSMTCQVH